jgi:hypothetical protein
MASSPSHHAWRELTPESQRWRVDAIRYRHADVPQHRRRHSAGQFDATENKRWNIQLRWQIRDRRHRRR